MNKNKALVALMRHTKVGTGIVDRTQQLMAQDGPLSDSALDAIAEQAGLSEMWTVLTESGFRLAEAKKKPSFAGSLARFRRAGRDAPSSTPAPPRAPVTDFEVAATAAASRAHDASASPGRAPEAAEASGGASEASSSSSAEDSSEPMEPVDESDNDSTSSHEAAPIEAPLPSHAAEGTGAGHTPSPPPPSDIAREPADVILLHKARELNVPGASSASSLSEEIRERLRILAVATLRKVAQVFSPTGEVTSHVVDAAALYHGKEFLSLALDESGRLAADTKTALPPELTRILIDPGRAETAEFNLLIRQHAAMAYQCDSHVKAMDDANLVVSFDLQADKDINKLFDAAKLRSWQHELNERRIPLLVALASAKGICTSTMVLDGSRVVCTPSPQSEDDAAATGTHSPAAPSAHAAQRGFGLQVQHLRSMIALLQARYLQVVAKIQGEIRRAHGLETDIERALGIHTTPAAGKAPTSKRKSTIVGMAERTIMAKVAQEHALIRAAQNAAGAASRNKQSASGKGQARGKPNKRPRGKRKSGGDGGNSPAGSNHARSHPTTSQTRDGDRESFDRDRQHRDDHSAGPGAYAGKGAGHRDGGGKFRGHNRPPAPSKEAGGRD